jgi:small multidrug resistance family-3 protein
MASLNGTLSSANDTSAGVNAHNTTSLDETFHWTAVKILQAVVLFVAASFAEIGGGYMVWKSMREKKPYWWAILGSLILILYGFIPTLQPTNSFGRIYAVYGGFFIVMSFMAGWWWDGDRPDKGDVIGGLVSLAGVCLIMFWPRSKQ